MSECNNCEPCIPVYSDEVCDDIIKLKCSKYTGETIECLNIVKNVDTGDTAIRKIAEAVCNINNGGDDKFVRVSSTDNASGYLKDKLIAGNNIQLSQSTVGGTQVYVIDAVVPTSINPDLLVTTDSVINATQTGVKGHTLDLGIKIKSGENAITKTSTGLYSAPPDYKLKVNNTDTVPDYLIDKIVLKQDPLGIVIPQLVSLIGGKIGIGFTINLDVLCAALTANNCVSNTPSTCDIVITGLNVVANTDGSVAFNAVYSGTATGFRYIIDGNPAVQVSTNPFIVTNLPSGSHTISIQAKCSDGSFGLTYQKLFDVPFASTICPANIITNSTLNSVTFSWDSVGGATYIVELRTSSNGTVIQTANKTNNTHTFNGLNPSTNYYVKVNAVQNGIVSTGCPSTLVTTSAAPTCTATITGLSVSGLTTSGNATVSWASNGVASEYKLDNGSFVTGTSPLSLTGLTSGSHTIYVRSICDNTLSGPMVQTSFTIPVAQVTAFYGFKSTNTVLTQNEIELGTSTLITHNQTITADYKSNSAPMYLWMAEPITETAKTNWFASIDNNGNIGGSGDLFITPTVVNSAYRFYITAYKTANTQDTIQFRIDNG